MTLIRAQGLHASDFRQARKEQLSLALMSARNHVLHLAAQFEKSALGIAEVQQMLGHIGWFQEWWIARNVQRSQGATCEGGAVRLASVDTSADSLWQTPGLTPGAQVAQATPDLRAVHAYLL